MEKFIADNKTVFRIHKYAFAFLNEMYPRYDRHLAYRSDHALKPKRKSRTIYLERFIRDCSKIGCLAFGGGFSSYHRNLWFIEHHLYRVYHRERIQICPLLLGMMLNRIVILSNIHLYFRIVSIPSCVSHE